MMKDYLTFNFGESFFRDRKVIDLVLDKMPVSISLGLWTTLLVYLISIPLGIRKAINDGSRFDIASSSIITIGYAIPNFLFAGSWTDTEALTEFESAIESGDRCAEVIIQQSRKLG